MYIPLYNKSNYSLLSSLLKIDDIVEYAKKNNLPSIALTDTNMYGVMEFIKKCESNNIKPIIGLDIILEDFNIVLISKNYDGYKSLIKLSTIQNERKVEASDLEKYNKEVIGILPYKYNDKYNDLLKIYTDLYLGYTNKKEEKESLLITKNVVFFRENLYLNDIDREYLPYLYNIRDGKTISDDVTYDTLNHSLNITNILELTDNIGLTNSIKISDLCYLEFPKRENLLPLYECEDPSKYLFELCKAGLTKRLGGQIPDNYKNRLSYELNIITEMGFPNYFLVVYDFIKFAKKNKILVGPGRGSAAGSLVAYSLGITDIDPLEYDLLFERFLNPERKTMPDIDTDFPDDKRDEVINYVVEKYGKKRVSGIVTFGTLGAKQVIRDIARVLNIPSYKVDSLSKFIPAFTKDKLKDFYKKNTAFKARIDSDVSLSKLFKIACKLEGYPRHTSSHAAGIVMSKIDLDEVIPLTYSDGMYLTSYPMEYLEDLGLLKMDFLGLKNLTIINNIINDIKETTGEIVDFNKIPLDDKETLEIFETANTSGIFQFESTGMRNFLRNLRPNTFEDIFSAIALFRPGAAINIDSYIRRRHKEEEITYLDPSLEQITKNTYGILIYQEQIMQLANVYAGYTLGEADILRRAMSKKKIDLLKSEEEKFIKKSIEKGHREEQAKKLFELVLNFAGYGFNRSHSVAYSLIAYKMAYLKSHYKTIFFANLLTNVIGSEAKTHEYIMEAKANGIEVEKPSINKSSNRYVVLDNKIIYPVSNIKSIGGVVASNIMKARSDGEFIDIYDAFSRLYLAGVGKKNLETLIFADTFSCFKINRATLLYNLDSLFNYAELTKDIDPSLVMKPDLINQQDYEDSYLLEKEKEVYGFYLSHHPTTAYLKDNKYAIPLNTVEKYFSKKVDTLILVDKIKVINTKKGDKMAFITGSDETATCEYTLFPKVFNSYSNLERGDLLKVRGTVEKRLNTYQIIVEKIKYLKEKDKQDEE
ncbi:MAG: DNA polymerase III subunit alpha [Firmicutes bacterium]|nr:DNA polymerase III subunit alpha [Bacillota bacterium]